MCYRGFYVSLPAVSFLYVCIRCTPIRRSEEGGIPIYVAVKIACRDWRTALIIVTGMKKAATPQ